MTETQTVDLAALRIPNALQCRYYLFGEGKCTFGCWTEPSCQTDEPEGGWRIRDSRGRFISQEREAMIREWIRTQMLDRDTGCRCPGSELDPCPTWWVCPSRDGRDARH